jgi:hypothetical protein
MDNKIPDISTLKDTEMPKLRDIMRAGFNSKDHNFINTACKYIFNGVRGDDKCTS